MRRRLVQASIALAGALLVASLASGIFGAEPTAPDQAEETTPSAHASPIAEQEEEGPTDGHDHDHEPNTSEGDGPKLTAAQPRHDFALDDGEGEVPSRAEASELPFQFEDFLVEGDEGLETMLERGYLTGSGTEEDPYVIDGFRVTDDLRIKDTSSAIVIKNSYIEGQLTLNFVGEDVHVHHNHIYDLRVNENVERDGPTTSGLFEQNEIEFIGQLRHYGGTFAHNEIGPRPDGVVDRYLSDTGPADLPDEVVWNFDGYHLAHVNNNTVIGRVDAKLHGHFHGSCVACIHHDHAEPAAFPDGNEASEDLAPDSEHSFRFHTLDFENNTIRADEQQIALRFYDENHAGDDQTANSEPNAHLEDRHEHHQYVRVASNQLDGGSLVFDIVNAEDEDRHRGLVQEALVDLVGNEVTMDKPRGQAGLLSAYVVHAADTLTLDARGNTFAFQGEDSSVPSGYRWIAEGEPGETTGFLLDTVEATTVHVTGTRGQGASYGVTLHAVDDRTTVDLEDNRFNASEEDEHHA